jgi:diacylglycerol kinase family enzyme
MPRHEDRAPASQVNSSSITSLRYDSRRADDDASSTLYIVLNTGSGKSDAESPASVIAEVLSAAGRAHEIFEVDEAGRLDEIARQAVAKALQNGGTVVAAGGDGTLNTVAQATLGSGCPFGVIPQGTFNYFGRTHGIPGDTAEAARALLTARVEPVQVGLLNDRIFLVNASLGLYPQSLEIREEQKQRHGRSRLVAAWAGLLAVFRDYGPLQVRLEHDGGTRELRTLTMVVGNNRLQLEQMGFATQAVGDGRLAAVVLKPVSRLKLLWLFVRAALGRLSRSEDVESFTFRSLSVTPSRGRIRRLKVSTDGETAWTDTPVEFRISGAPLLLLKPVDAVPETARE